MWEVWSVMPRQALRGVLVGHRATEGFRSDLCFPSWGLLVSADVMSSTLLTTWTNTESLKLSCVVQPESDLS